MIQKDIIEILNKQKKFLVTGKSRDTEFRINALKSLKNAIIRNESEIIEALEKDLKKPLVESYTSELGMVIAEINYAMKNLKKWVKPQKVKSNLMVFPSKSAILTEPYGRVLIISPWNYPIQLTMAPLVSVIAAGNCCVVKPSELSPCTSQVIKKVLAEAFEEEYIAVIEGDADVSGYLLEQKFDKIFFTGSPSVGKIVMEKAARNLTPVTLELGGKNPCIVDKNVDIDVAAKRILWGKFTNDGQTCIAPDYLIVHRDIKEKLYEVFRKWMCIFYSDHPENSPDLGRIINVKHFRRILGYLSDGKIILGGKSNEKELYIEPAVIEVTDLNATVMQDEIFGPVLPVIEFSCSDEIEKIISLNPDPLGFYIFSKDKELVKKLVSNVTFGGGCINDTLSHAINQNLPFGGRGKSGIGSYHGKFGFDVFSHKKAVLKKGFRFDFPFKYPPYKDGHKYIRSFVMK